MPCTKSRLEEIGFRPVGSWRLRDNRLEFALDSERDATNILYAFVVDDEAKYIGKTDQTLTQRMSGYKRPGGTQSTNIEVNSKIVDSLTDGHDVQILVLAFQEQLQFAGISIDMASGLEVPLIRMCNPEWNRLQRGAA